MVLAIPNYTREKKRKGGDGETLYNTQQGILLGGNIHDKQTVLDSTGCRLQVQGIKTVCVQSHSAGAIGVAQVRTFCPRVGVRLGSVLETWARQNGG